MADEQLLADLQRLKQQTVEGRSRALAAVEHQRKLVEMANERLRNASDAEQRAIQEDEEVKAEQKRLTDHVNGLVDKPQVLLKRISELGARQQETFRTRQKLGLGTRAHRQQFDEADRALAGAESELKRVDKDLADVDAQIQLVRGS
jgi:chromosome segregation ATPase